MLARLIQEADFDSVVGLAAEMHAEAPTYRDFAFDPDRVRSLCQLCLDANEWICVVVEDDDGLLIGFTAAGVVPTLFGHELVAEDLAFYVHPSRRGTTAAVRMLRMIETWAKALGAKAIRMGITTGTNPAQTAKFLSRFGYVETGWLYTKSV